ncbi:C4-dicarboxylate transport protein [Klebsiella pneumoniae]|uniref:C4-dicarboxylate transport protein n=1 Tax=Klebsiella pneumoniae TaxID=573 RepID=A0A2X1Q808_KLEPN|nr:C4-dicarboxylate transport protein [Klebsiella pneumoniae]
MANANKLTLFIVVFMLMGILSGAAIHTYATPTTVSAWADNITLLTDLFLRLIKMVIAPLVFSTLTVGIMRLGETATIGRVGGKAMVWFITSSVLSILVGLVIVTFQHPGAGLNLSVPKEAVDTGLVVSGMSLKGFLSHTIPTSITEAMANNEILQIVVFSMFFGIAGASLGEKFNAPLVAALNVVSHIMLKVTGYVMYVAPLAIFAAISSVIASQGLGILLKLCFVHRRLLPGGAVDQRGADCRRLYGAEKRGFPPAEHAERSGAGGLYHQQLGSGLSEDP